MQEDWNIILSITDCPDKTIVGQQKIFSTSPISLGRAESNDFVIPDASASRNHAVIRITNDYTRVFINDSSTYGTEVSGKSVPKGPGAGFTLSTGDIIKIGTTTVSFELNLKQSVQATLIGTMDRSFLDAPSAPEAKTELKEPDPVVIPEPSLPEPEEKKGLSPLFIGFILLCTILIFYLLFS